MTQWKSAFLIPAQEHVHLKNTSNHYTNFLDLNPANVAWPKRSKSLICTTSKSRAEEYTFGRNPTVVRVFPFDGVEIAEVMKQDMWDVVPVNAMKLKTGIARFNDVWGKMFKGVDDKLSVTKAQALLKKMPASEFEAFLKKDFYYLGLHDDLLADVEGARQKLIASMETTYAYELNPKSFTLHSSSQGLGKNHEVWFSGKCVIVPQSKWKLIK